MLQVTEGCIPDRRLHILGAQPMALGVQQATLFDRQAAAAVAKGVPHPELVFQAGPDRLRLRLLLLAFLLREVIATSSLTTLALDLAPSLSLSLSLSLAPSL